MKMFNYQKICDSFIKNLPQRTTDVIERRFGLKGKNRETLESIGQSYEITRERVRQIEEDALNQIQPKVKENLKVFQYFKDELASFGGLKEEGALLGYLGGRESQNRVYFLLNLSENFKRVAEDNDFYSLWTIKKETVKQAKKAVKLTINKLKKEKTPLTLNELFRIRKKELSKVLVGKLTQNVFLSCLEISKEIQKNPEELYGLRDWLEINPRGVKDKAYLVLKKEGKPLHFGQVAVFIDKLPFPAQGKSHIATVHNELIKDQRFVLVGRGLYALTEWGYEPGVVKDIIYKTLKRSKRPLSKQEILEKVLEQRFVKENTVALNLQDRGYFLRDDKGRYTVREA